MKSDKPTYEELVKKLAAAEKRVARLEKRKKVAGNLHNSELAEAYLASEQNFKNSMDASPLGIRIVTEEGELIYANKAMLEICGYNSAEEMAAVPRDLLYTQESYQAHLERKRKRKLHEYVPLEYEIGIRRSDGEIRNLQVFRRQVIWGGEQQYMAMYQDITEHKRAEEALKESEEKFHSIIEHSNDVIVFLQDGKIQYCNSKLTEISGYSQKDILGKSFIDFIAPGYKEKALDVYSRRVAGKKAPDKYELCILAKDGHIIYTEVSASMTTYKQTPVDISIIRDITGRIKAQEALKESEEKFSKAFQASPDAVTITTLDEGIILDTNDTAVKNTGYSMEELIGHNVFELNLWVDMKEHDKMHRMIVDEGKVINEEFHFRKKSGEIRTWEFSAESITVGGKKCLISTQRDITESKQAEEALAGELLRRRILIEQSRDGIVILDQSGAVYEVNQRFADMLGYTMDEVKQLHVFDWEFLMASDRLIEMINTVDEKGDHFETKHRRKDGTIYDVEISTNGAVFAGQKLIFCVCRDITERKKMEKAVEESEAKYHSIYENSKDAILLTRPDGKILAANAEACRIFGKTEEEICQGGRNGIIDTSDPRLKQALEIRRITGEFAGELTFLRADGTKFPGEMASRIFVDKDGQEKTSMIIRDITEDKKAEEAVKESEARFRSLFETMAQGVIYHDSEGKIISANPAAENILGMPLHQMIGKTSLDPKRNRLREDGTDFSSEQHPSIVALRTGKTVNNVIMGILNPVDKEYRWVIISAIPEFKQGEKKPYRVYTTFTDITELRKMQEELEREGKEIRLIMDSSAALIWYKNKDGKFLRVNKAFADALHMTPDEFAGKTVYDLYSPDIAKKMTADDLEVFTAEQPKLNIIEQYESATGLRWVRTDKIPVLDKNGKATAVIGFAQDITASKIAEERINYLNQTLRSIRNVNQLITREKDHDKLLQGVCDTLVESRSFSTAWIALLDESNKLKTQAVSGIAGSFPALVIELEKGNIQPCVRKALKKTQVIVTEDPKTMCPDCPLQPYNEDIGSMTTRLEYDGIVYGVLCASLPREILSDANEITLFEEVASDIAFSLYNMEREAQYSSLEQERLRAAKLESIGTLAGGIAHDFNNLLTGIMGNIGLVKTRLAPTDDAYEMLDEAEKAAIRAKDLTQQLLTFARGGKPVKTIVNIADVTKESATFALRGSKVSLKLALPEDLWTIEADEGQISQVINNLTINADEAMPSGGTLKITAENLSLKKTDIPLLTGRDYVRIDIADSGMGISAEHLQRIFEPYFTTKQRGSGLGLTSAYSIVRNHGGIVLVDSVLNKGSTFHIYLPAVKVTVKGSKKMREKSSGQAGGKVLVMDDEEMIRKMLQNMLKMAGYTVEVSADGAEAIKKYQQAINNGDPFNAVIMDLTIPGGMGGKEAIKKLLKIDPKALAIVSSGYATDPIMSEYKKYGFKAVIAKPYSIKTLQETLSSLLTKKK